MLLSRSERRHRRRRGCRRRRFAGKDVFVRTRFVPASRSQEAVFFLVKLIGISGLIADTTRNLGAMFFVFVLLHLMLRRRELFTLHINSYIPAPLAVHLLKKSFLRL